LQYYIQKLEDETDYEFKFERMKTVTDKIHEMAGEEPEEPKVVEINDEEEKKEDLMEKLTKPTKTINLEEIEDGDEGEAQDEEGDRKLLQGFKDANIQIHLLGGEDDLKKLKTKKKFRSLFDVGCLSMHSASTISEELGALFKDRATVHVESADYLCVMKPEQKIEFRTKLIDKSAEANWKLVTPAPYKHHMMFEVSNPNTQKDLAEKD